MGGNIKVESVLGEGSSFMITIQLKVKDKIVDFPAQMKQQKKDKIYKIMGAFMYSEQFN